jgi:hypothetical protein
MGTCPTKILFYKINPKADRARDSNFNHPYTQCNNDFKGNELRREYLSISVLVAIVNYSTNECLYKNLS